MAQDRKLISWNQKHEVNYILNHFVDKATGDELTLSALKYVGKNLGKKGKYCTSRRLVYIGLRAIGYYFKP